MESLSALQFQVLNHENAVEKFAKGTTPSKKCTNIASSKLLTRNQSFSSFSLIFIFMPRPSVDNNY